MSLMSSGALNRCAGGTTGEENAMALKEYDVVINGVATTVQLSDRDAEARGLTKPKQEVVKAATKKATPRNKSGA